MILGKFSRFIKRYDLTLSTRHKSAVAVKIVDDANLPSVLKALHRAIASGTATRPAANGDEVELIKATHDTARGVIVLLFHRDSPNAADPMYRKKLADKSVKVRKADKAADEEQSHSAHFVISVDPFAPGRYKAALEEVPGISIGVIDPIISDALRDYPYNYLDARGQTQQSYTTFKAAGVKSETLKDALQKGQCKFLTLVRPGDAEIVDGDGLFETIDQRMKIRIKGVVDGQSMFSRIDDLIQRAKDAGWEQFNVDLNLENSRKRTVKMERDDEAKNVLFVRAEEVSVNDELPLCSTEIIDELVEKAVAVIAMG